MATGSYTFRWEHPAKEVYVTGTFDDWGKTVQLEKNAEGVFEKTVQLPKSDKIYYKFVKDGEWVTSHTAPTETDDSGNTNNVLKPTDFLSSAAPTSSTAAMAGAVPTESEKATSSAPGAFPETPAAQSSEPKEFSVNPIPASAGTGNPVDLKPGDEVPDPSTINSNTVSSTAYDDPELKAKDQTFSVNPIPATAGTGNPVDLKPGEKVPPASEVTSNTVNSTVKTDKASYEKSDAYPTDGTASKDMDTGAGMFGVPPVTSGLIPESSLPMGKDAPSAKDADPGVTVQSAAPGSTTAQLAGQVPLEPKQGSVPGVPSEVVESQKEAGADPEASANPEAVKEKAEVEDELLKKVKPTEASGEPAPTTTAATSSTAPATTAAAGGAKGDLKPAADAKQPLASRDVSPMTKQPRAADSKDAETPKKDAAKADTPKKESAGRRLSAAFKKVAGEGGSSSTGAGATKEGSKTEGKEKKRRSFFGKIKDALK